MDRSSRVPRRPAAVSHRLFFFRRRIFVSPLTCCALGFRRTSKSRGYGCARQLRWAKKTSCSRSNIRTPPRCAGDPSEEIADDARSLACAHKKMRVASRPWWPSKSVGIEFPGRSEDTAKTAISGRQRAKLCRQDIDIGSACKFLRLPNREIKPKNWGIKSTIRELNRPSTERSARSEKGRLRRPARVHSASVGASLRPPS
jgi:hypothetical protein